MVIADQGHRDRKTYNILTFQSIEPAVWVVSDVGAEIVRQLVDVLDAGATGKLAIFLLWFFEDAGCSAQLAATTGSLWNNKPGRGGMTGPGGGDGVSGTRTAGGSLE